MSFGVQTHNAFFLLDDDAPAPKPKAAPKVETPAPKPVKKTENGRDNNARGNRNNRSRDNTNRPRSGNAARGRGGRAPRDGKREFDRHESGTGRDRGAKKGGNGRGNWGTDADQAQGERSERPRRERNNNRRPRRDDDKKPAAEKTEKVEGQPTEAKPEGEAPKKEETNDEDKEEEDKTIGYDEYLKELEKKKAEVDGGKALRVVQNDDSQWGTLNEVKKEVVEGPMDTYAYADTKKSIKGKKNRKGKSKPSAVNIDQFMSEGKNSGRGQGRGGRGRGRGGGRGGNSRANFNLDKDFPTIGGN